ncbi:MAG TPA: DNA gyrase subunit B [Devosia sp.]
MAATTDMAPNRNNGASSRTATRRTAAARTAAARRTEPDLEAQVQQLQNDIKAIAATLATMAEEKVGEAQSLAKRELRNLKAQGQSAVEDAQDEFGQLEKQIKDTIREKPLTAVAGAIALGFILAVVSR